MRGATPCIKDRQRLKIRQLQSVTSRAVDGIDPCQLPPLWPSPDSLQRQRHRQRDRHDSHDQCSLVNWKGRLGPCDKRPIENLPHLNVRLSPSASSCNLSDVELTSNCVAACVPDRLKLPDDRQHIGRKLRRLRPTGHAHALHCAGAVGGRAQPLSARLGGRQSW